MCLRIAKGPNIRELRFIELTLTEELVVQWTAPQASARQIFPRLQHFEGIFETNAFLLLAPHLSLNLVTLKLRVNYVNSTSTLHAVSSYRQLQLVKVAFWEGDERYSPDAILAVAKNCSYLRSFEFANAFLGRADRFAQLTPLTDDHIEALVKFLPHLQSFRLDLHFPTGLTKETLRLLGTHMRELETLRLATPMDLSFKDIVPDDQVLFPKLRVLKLWYFHTSDVVEELAETFFRHAPRLQVLDCPHFSRDYDDPGDTIWWMVQKCREGVPPEQRTLEKYKEHKVASIT